MKYMVKRNVLQLFCSVGYPMITYTHPAASNLRIKTLVAKQRPTNIIIYLSAHMLLIQVLACRVVYDQSQGWNSGFISTSFFVVAKGLRQLDRRQG